MSEEYGRTKRKLKQAVFLLLPVVVLLFTVETCTTLAIERAGGTATDPESGQTQYTMRIGKFPWSHRSVTRLNSQGFPDVEYSSLGEKGDCAHLVFVGDSFVFGDGVDDDSSFVGLIREWSATAVGDRCVRVFNLAVRGTTIDRQTRHVRETIEVLQPDVVILGQYQNDLTDLLQLEESRQQQGLAAHKASWRDVRRRMNPLNLNVVRFMSYHMFGLFITHNKRYDVLHHWSVVADSTRAETAHKLKHRYTEIFASLANDLEQRGVAFGTIILPSKFDLLAGRYPEEHFFVRLAELHSLPYLRTYPVLDTNRDPYPFFMYDGHLNEHGNRLVAAAVRAWLFEAEPAPFERLRKQ